MASRSESQNNDIINWEEYFMGVALLSARRCKEPKKKGGACIVNTNKRIVGLGYNGFPDNIPYNDDQLQWKENAHLYGSLLNYKDEWQIQSADGYCKSRHNNVDCIHVDDMCHAEMNAIVNKLSVDIAGCTMYTTLFPCNECAKLICQSRLGRVVYLERKVEDDKGVYNAAENMFQKAGIEMVKYVPNRTIELEI